MNKKLNEQQNRCIPFKKFWVILFLFMLNFQIACSETIDSNDLTLYIESPEEIVEANVFTVTILANETPVKDVVVILMDNNRQFEDQQNVEITNIYGKVQFTAPSLIYDPSDKTYSIVAIKVGYITNEKNITVINIPNLLIKEEIKTKYKRDEIVTITVIDNASKPVENATIQFEDNTYYSDDNGKVILITPSHNGLYKLKITKEGYANYLVNIIVNEPKLHYGPMIAFLSVLGMCIVFIVLIIVSIVVKKVLNKKARKK